MRWKCTARRTWSRVSQPFDPVAVPSPPRSPGAHRAAISARPYPHACEGDRAEELTIRERIRSGKAGTTRGAGAKSVSPRLRSVRAVLVVNPQATSTTAAGRDVLAHALASELKLDVVETQYRGHAADAARQAVDEGVDLVIAHGGDGTVNEVVNGMFYGVPTDNPPDVLSLPKLGVVPGGSANVFARALGLPRDPVEATHRLLRAISSSSTRRIGLGRANDRWFTFNAGVGWDADVVAEVERLRTRGRNVTPALYARTALTCYFRVSQRRPLITVQAGDEEPVTDLHTTFVSNTDPWTYLGSRPMRMNPDTTFDTGLGVFSLRSMNAYSVLRHVAKMLRGRAKPHGRNSFQRADLGYLQVTCEEPLRLQVDGDNLGERSLIEFASIPEALRVTV
jgi:diacylglycerol kinase family enzyme